MKFKKGDIVFFVDANDNVKKAPIKCVHRKDPEFPYELDINSKNRFYPEDCVFATMEEAVDGVRDSQQSRMTEAIKNGHPVTMTQDLQLPEELPRYFSVPEKQRMELDKLCTAVDTYCTKNHIPYMLSVVMARKQVKEKNGAMELVRATSCFPGLRTPEWMLELWDAQDEILGFGPEEH